MATDEQGKKAAAAAAKIAAKGAGIPTRAGRATDSQNAARLAAEAKAKPSRFDSQMAGEALAAEEAKKAYALSPAGIKAGIAAYYAANPTGKVKDPDKPVQPGKAWTWDGKAWVKPDKPGDGKSYTWDDNNGWTLSVEGTDDTVEKGDPPGKAWVWNGTKWVQPDKPGDDKPYTWDNDKGWVAEDAPVGTPPAYIYDPKTKTWIMPPKPTGAGNWVFDANDGWIESTIVPGSSGMSLGSDKTLALDTFKNTLALLFGVEEVNKPWVNALYASASKFLNTGSTIDESINLSLQDIRYNKELKPFTDRFNGIYALTDRLAGGEAIEVPTIAEYFKSESAMGDVLRAAGMGELANQNFLGGVIGLGKSVLEVTNLITDTFDRIDNAPGALGEDLKTLLNKGVDRVSIAKALLTGKEGALELNKKIKSIEQFSAAKSQGVAIDLEMGADLAAGGAEYGTSLAKFGTVKQLERGQMLGKMSGIDFTQNEAIASTFQSDAAAAEKIRRIKEEEANRFSGSSGRFASKDRAEGLI